MEGSESEQEKSVKRGSPEVKRKRVDKKKMKHSASRVEGGVDASQGSSECKSFNKKKKKKKKHAARLEKGTDVSLGDMAGGSDRHQVKRKRRVKEESFSGLQRFTDASSKGEIAGGSEHRQVKRKRVKHKRGLSCLAEFREQLHLQHAKMALEFYEKSQDDAEFEILRVLYTSHLSLQHPDSECAHLWFHVSFIAKPREADSNISPTHFFGELFRDQDSGRTHVTYCSTFQPSDDPGFNHGCIFCPIGQKLHPSDGYCVGRPPWHKEKRVCGHPPWRMKRD
ncbi:hypothetical protein DCAR_0728505 [Daucus carota subsp. sativus]|uniref:DUF3615 domain-containing protein n=1 Tax=Daucus carota subsp. sativus TaxID=79200 RepID=A0A161X5Q0_DAUCS|nr:PREDICTED: uncharacterized protein LOC108193225 [Daucus carota subsp. sativus]WOH09052.1 hypothetical protein DCAR_0728505 [Daucus carota subsp. sativus]